MATEVHNIAIITYGSFGDVECFNHALVVAVGGVVATDVSTAGLLYDVGVGQTRAALVLRVEGQTEETFGHPGWTGLPVTVRVHQWDEQ